MTVTINVHIPMDIQRLTLLFMNEQLLEVGALGSWRTRRGLRGGGGSGGGGGHGGRQQAQLCRQLLHVSLEVVLEPAPLARVVYGVDAGDEEEEQASADGERQHHHLPVPHQRLRRRERLLLLLLLLRLRLAVVRPVRRLGRHGLRDCRVLLELRRGLGQQRLPGGGRLVAGGDVAVAVRLAVAAVGVVAVLPPAAAVLPVLRRLVPPLRVHRRRPVERAGAVLRRRAVGGLLRERRGRR